MIERGRSRGRAEAWRPWIAAGRRPALAWPHGLTDFVRRAAQRVREWAAVEAAPGRLVPWLAIGFGSGTIIYFAVEREPALSAAALVLADGTREAIDKRIRTILPGDNGAIASAADHRQTRHHLDAGERSDVRVGPRPCALDLRLSHGGGSRHHVLYAARAVCAHAGLR
jgi:hypothetical protein